MDKIIAVLIIVALVGCGSGGSSSNHSSSSSSGSGGSSGSGSNPLTLTATAGLYQIATSTGRSGSILVTNSGEFWIIYSLIDNGDLVAGFMQGNAQIGSAAIASSNAIDFNFEGFGNHPTTVSGSVNGQTASVTITNNASHSTMTASGAFDTQYNVTPSTDLLAGTFSGQSAGFTGVESQTIAITTAGAITTVSAAGCHSSGTIAPGSGGNYFTFMLTFSGSPCLYPGEVISGVAYLDATANLLYLGAVDQSRSKGILFIGLN